MYRIGPSGPAYIFSSRLRRRSRGRSGDPACTVKWQWISGRAHGHDGQNSDGSSSAVGAEASQGDPVALPQYPGPVPGHSPESTAQYKMELIDATGYVVVTLSRRRVVTGTLEELSAAYNETERHNTTCPSGWAAGVRPSG